ncbi:serine/threonine-protein kinase SBK1-like [Hyla sarda]|uniref:serine/threonine-protein kinase SBK1-like n=1 Tax=Hyla sarda TaxID=327740 RepID=UPI0024C444C8|nr:serine/threonine-protein kinase SBK1-like [Hyla sarda]
METGTSTAVVRCFSLNVDVDMDSNEPPSPVVTRVYGAGGNGDSMASSKQDVQLILEGLVSIASQGLQEIDLQENYQVIQELGDGGYGSVLMVKDKKTDDTMALKLLYRQKTTEFSFLMEFCTSFFLSSHPNIIGIYGTAFMTDDCFAYTQELATNGDLFSLIPSNDGLPEDMVKRCAVQISSALEFIESKGLVHMDIKPENILVFHKDCHLIKITDFGLSRVKGTITKTVSGSRIFMAPEIRQLTDQDTLVIDSSLDVWSFGVVLCCLLTGKSPWQSADPSDQEYCNFVEWQNNFGSMELLSLWRTLSPQALKMFSGLLAIDCNRRSKCTKVLMFLDECWKEEIPETTDVVVATEVKLSEDSGPENVHHSSVSTTSTCSTESYYLTSDSSHGQEHPEHCNDDIQYPSIFEEVKILVNVSEEVEIG